jgi:hypothetical protein
MSREQRDRMAETFVAVYDALQRAPVPMYQVTLPKAPDLPRPGYLPPVPPQTPGQYRAALAKLGKLGMVKERTH